jgi:hypothetical protein
MQFTQNCPEPGEHFNKLLRSVGFIILTIKSTVSGHKTPFFRAVSLQIVDLCKATPQRLIGM